ncbi:class I SAM-dependent methyltransferase [Cellulomonas wangsupingiae]|uniref:Class I SAM-dependent methyltransferase n=1 Tax=Cellulomonas wangsupingiae TaxID=2968085 RepID=A0ABY5K751_9CELL|nr:class I SAM-dependent methyltransferase [Cellulomonas wangsupingiae]MCC2334758.1 class I SAM-dependent methyltransferase [Cellulomonas wangsupingiae]UUI66286.1 class I SAM-dependent methyltransferase [Cellulomonas wangsupingiae]
MTDDRQTAHAASFTHNADEYAAVRPGYPEEAVDLLLPDGARDVLDLAAGTGKLTQALVARGVRVVAVEPADGMREQLVALLPQVEVHAGTAEAIPLPDASLDAVTVAQAWHWFDEPAAAAEVARVLRPGGTLGIVWNDRDEDVPWVGAYGALLHEVAGPQLARGTHPTLGDAFTDVLRTDVRWEHAVSPEDLVRLAGTRSYALVLPADERAALLERVRTLVTTHPDLVGRERVAVPYTTRVYTARRR